ncbi:MAG: protein translocase component YidC [Trueperaceae bacterium]|nr:MAG: protein translocase component YidC [Trueperaceae bacterium]
MTHHPPRPALRARRGFRARPALWAFALLAPFLLSACLMPTSMREPFGPTPFAASEFRDFSQLQEHCAGSAPTSFWCTDLEQRVDRVPTKGVDVFFSEAGEIVAAFAKFQKGQNLPNYASNNADNLIPREAPFPGGAILLDGEYHPPQNVEGSWTRLTEVEFEGRFAYTLPGYQVDKTIVISNVEQTLRTEVTLTPLANDDPVADADDGDDDAAVAATASVVQYAFPGIARQQSPTIKIGQATTFALNPITAPVDDPSYVSLQSAANNTGNAIVLVRGNGAPLQGISLGGGRAALQKPLGEDETTMVVGAYLGKNELVRFYQEGYLDLPGLFNPNILGRLSLWILATLMFIHEYVPSWGLSIIVLTLGFRVLVAPLITTQTKSMFGMQKLQPEMQKLQKKYKDDREKLSQEMMKLYKEAGVNPAGGCLPILLQMPLFIILWRVFVNFEFNEGFLWIPDLGLADPFYILPALYVAVMLGQSWYSARNNPTMLRQSIIINLVFVFIIVNFPSGVLVYFVVSMGVQVFQYWLLSRGQTPPPAPAVPAKAK